MDGVTELATRLLFCAIGPPEFMGTPFLRVTTSFPVFRVGLLYAPELDRLRSYVPYQLIPQLMAADADDFVRVADALLLKSELVELNCGCPSPIVVGGGAGSALLQDSEKFLKFVGSCSMRLGPGKLAIKMRTGYEDSAGFLQTVKELAKFPLARLSVHGRTRLDRYQGMARWDLIRSAAAAAPFDVWGSGDICDHEGLVLRAQEASLKGVLIGRGGLRNPWIFESVAENRSTILEPQVLEFFFATFVTLQTAFLRGDHSLISLCETGLFHSAAGTSLLKWADFFEKVSLGVFGGAHEILHLPVDRKAYARVKMMWHYLRSSLPAHMMSPAPLRTTSWPDFIGCLRDLSGKVCVDGKTSIDLSHKPEHDWVYSGGRSEAQE